MSQFVFGLIDFQHVSFGASIFVSVIACLTFLLGMPAKIRLAIDWLAFWSAESRKIQTPGYLAPKTGPVMCKILRAIFFLKGKIESVNIDVIGRENIPADRFIIAANHVDIGDVDVLSEIVGARAGRFLITSAEVLPGTAEGILMTVAGAIPVDQSSRRSKYGAMTTAARALVEDGHDAILAIFPQGQLDTDEKLEPELFKRGCSEIAFHAGEELAGQRLWILPVGIHCKRDVSKVPLKYKVLKAVANFVMPLKHDGQPFFSSSKYRTIAAIGKPISAHTYGAATAELPEDGEMATACIYRAIKAAHETARKA